MGRSSSSGSTTRGRRQIRRPKNPITQGGREEEKLAALFRIFEQLLAELELREVHSLTKWAKGEPLEEFCRLFPDTKNIANYKAVSTKFSQCFPTASPTEIPPVVCESASRTSQEQRESVCYLQTRHSLT